MRGRLKAKSLVVRSMAEHDDEWKGFLPHSFNAVSNQFSANSLSLVGSTAIGASPIP